MRVQRILEAYGLAVLLSALAFLIMFAFQTWLTSGRLALFLCAVAISAWFGGLGPGLLATLLGALTLDYLFFPPTFSLGLSRVEDLVVLVEFAIIAGATAILLSLLRTSTERVARNLALLDAFFAAAPVGMAFLDPDLRYVRVNQALATMNGFTLAGHSGRTVAEVIPEGAPVLVPMLRRVLITGEPVRNQEVSLVIAGEPRCALVNYYPARTPSGQLLGVGVVLMEITQRKREEEERDRLASQLNLLLESAGEGIYGIDLQGRCTFVNRAAAEVLGYQPNELLGKNMHSAIHFQHADGTPYAEDQCPIFQVFRTGEGVRVDNDVFWRRNGVPFPVEYSSFPMIARGAIEGAVVTFADITERKEAEVVRDRLIHEQAARTVTEVERARLQGILQGSPSGIIYVDAATGHVQANPAAVEIFGHPIVPDRGREQYLGQMLHPDSRPFDLDELPTSHALKGETVLGTDVLIIRPSGQRVPARASAAPIRDGRGRIIGVVAAIQDMTAQRELERLREEWISVIAHDLRQPATVIAGYADLLAKRVGPAVPIEQSRTIGHIQSSSRQLNRMISDLLDVSRIEARRLTLKRQPMDIVELVQDVVERTREVTRGHPVRIEINGEISGVSADPLRIEQILTNLLSNAAKYGEQNTEILVEVARKGESIEIAITNCGPGITAEELPRIFTRFYRTPEATTGRAPGLGLGLYITKGLVEAHGGRIWAVSVPNQATTFCFTLPATG